MEETLMTEAQLKARRENAKRSTGPRTIEGRKRSSLNAFRHGLTGQIVVHTPMSAQAKPLCAVGEDQQAFKKHCDGIREALAPVGALETDLAQAIAEDRWRLNRARALENAIFALGQTEDVPQDSDNLELDAALAQARTWIAHARELNLLTIYENRIRRSVEKNTAELRALQAERKAPIAKELPVKSQRSDPPGRQDDHPPAGDPPPEPAGFIPARQGGGDQPLGFVSSTPDTEGDSPGPNPPASRPWRMYTPSLGGIPGGERVRIHLRSREITKQVKRSDVTYFRPRLACGGRASARARL
jgi:hypothetical protein